MLTVGGHRRGRAGFPKRDITVYVWNTEICGALVFSELTGDRLKSYAGAA
jgi:hypothetical protein